MSDARTWIRGVRCRVAALFSAFLIATPLMASSQTVTAMWDPSPPADQVTSYDVCIGTASLSCNVQLASVSSSQTTFTFTPAGGVLHYVAVRAVNPSGVGSYSSETSFSIPGFPQPPNRSTAVNVAIAPVSFSVTDPDGSALSYTHTGLPVGLSLNQTTGQITGTPTTAGTYTVNIFVTDSLTTVSRSFTWTVTSPASSDTTAPALSITSHTTGQTLTTTSATISGTASDSGRGGNGVASVTVNGQAATGTATGSNTANWSRALTLVSGANTITVQASDSAGNAATQQITLNVSLPIAPVTSATLSANLASPRNTGTAITFTATGSGGVAPRQYKFFVQQGTSAAQTAQNWSTTATYTWTPTVAASYTVTVWARSAGVTADAAQASAQMSYVVNTPPPATVTGATLSANLASPRNTGTAITFTATGSGGVAPRQYKFFVQQGTSAAQTVQNWSTTATYTWTPTTAASYTVTVWARSAGVTTDAAQASAQMPYVVNVSVAPLSLTGLTSNLPSPQATGTAITFTPTAAGGTSPYQYKWWLFDGTTWTMLRDWTATTTYTWTPTAANPNYRIGVWARNANTTTDSSAVNLSVPFAITGSAPAPPPAPTPTPTPTPSAVRITGLTSNLASPQTTGTSITFTPSATGGTAPYQYKWWLFDGTTWTMIRNWSATTTYTWTPTAASANYRIGIWARDATTTADTSAVNLSVPFGITGSAPAPTPTPTPSPLRITGLTSNLPSPQATGTAITFTPAASGGTAPYQYKWWLFDGTTWTMIRNWSATTTYTWTPTAAGANYRIGIWARDASTTADISAVNLSVPFAVRGTAPPPAPSPTPTPTPTPSPSAVRITGLTSTLPSPQAAGTPVTFTASASGGTAPYQFKYLLFDGATWTIARDWSTAATYTWTPTNPGTNYRIGLWARDATTTADVSNANLSVAWVVWDAPAAPSTLTATGILKSVATPRAGVPVTLTGLAGGGQAPYQFKWWVFDGTTWTMVRDWGGATYTWTPPTAGDYRIGVWVRGASTTADTGAVNLSVPMTVAP